MGMTALQVTIAALVCSAKFAKFCLMRKVRKIFSYAGEQGIGIDGHAGKACCGVFFSRDVYKAKYPETCFAWCSDYCSSLSIRPSQLGGAVVLPSSGYGVALSPASLRVFSPKVAPLIAD
jgi:hypothetical protein